MHFKFPLAINAKRFESASASLKEFVVNIIVDIPFCRDIFDNSLHRSLFAVGSIPLDGSSSKIAFGLPIKANAVDNFLLLPPESVPETAF